MYEYDAENYQLKEKANHLEIQLKERYEELDQLRNQQERNNIEQSNALTEKDRQIAALLESQTGQSVETSHLELSELSKTSGGLQSVLGDISEVSNSLLTCQSCCSAENSSKLAEAVSQLQFLTKVICHDGQHDIYRCASEDNILGIEMEAHEVCSDSERQKEEEEDRLLELQLVELTSKLDRMETEMCLVSEESKNLQQAVEIKDSVILDQVAALHQNFAPSTLQFLIHHHTITITLFHFSSTIRPWLWWQPPDYFLLFYFRCSDSSSQSCPSLS